MNQRVSEWAKENMGFDSSSCPVGLRPSEKIAAKMKPHPLRAGLTERTRNL